MQSAVEPPGRQLLLSRALDVETAAEFEALVLTLSADGTDAVKLDLRKLDVIDPLGVRAVVLAYAVCESDGLDFQLVPGSPQVQRVFSRCGTVDLLPFTTASRRHSLGKSPKGKRKKERAMSDEQTSKPGTIVGGPVEASPVDRHTTFGYRIKREKATRDVSVYVPATSLEADPASLGAPMRRIIASRGRSALEEELARGG